MELTWTCSRSKGNVVNCNVTQIVLPNFTFKDDLDEDRKINTEALIFKRKEEGKAWGVCADFEGGE